MLAFNLGGQEIALIGIAVLLLFGAKRLPEVFRSLGQGISEFKRASREVFREIEEDRPGQSQQKQPRESGAGPDATTAGTAEGHGAGSETKGDQ